MLLHMLAVHIHSNYIPANSVIQQLDVTGLVAGWYSVPIVQQTTLRHQTTLWSVEGLLKPVKTLSILTTRSLLCSHKPYCSQLYTAEYNFQLTKQPLYLHALTLKCYPTDQARSLKLMGQHSHYCLSSEHCERVHHESSCPTLNTYAY